MAGDLDLALKIAADAHRGQRDQGGQPYILHPIRVMMAMATEEHRIVALLHDVVEDSTVGLPLVRYEFGDRIAAAVDALTKRVGESYDAYLARVKGDDIATTVKLADLRDNSDLSRLGRSPTEADRKRLEKYQRARVILSSPPLTDPLKE